jgi:hypothetical protein
MKSARPRSGAARVGSYCDSSPYEFRVQGSGFRVQGSGFRVQGSGFRVQGVSCRGKVQG